MDDLQVVRLWKFYEEIIIDMFVDSYLQFTCYYLYVYFSFFCSPCRVHCAPQKKKNNFIGMYVCVHSVIITRKLCVKYDEHK